MSTARHVAVIDVGKTNAKLALVDTERLEEIAVVTRPNTVRPGPPYPHFDLEGHWDFFLTHLRAFHASHGIDGISVTTHGASAVLLDGEGALACPMLDYEHSGPDDLAAAYDALRPPFARTGSARLPMGLNLGAQLHWLLETQEGLRERLAHVVTYPQYWGYRLTGRFATDVSSLGCHTDLWDPWQGCPSDLPAALGIEGALASAHKASDVLGVISTEVAVQTGLAPDTPVLCGIHDSNASLLPHLQARQGGFSVVSTGTWVICMAVAGREVALDPARDVLVNVSAQGDPVPSSRFMGGREYELIRDGSAAEPSEADRARVLADRISLLPAVVSDSGPFAGRRHRWTGAPATDGERIYALSLYLALMTRTCLDLIGAQGPVVVEGPFARNPDYLAMLAALSPEGVEISASATGTSIGAALLFGPAGAPPPPRRVAAADPRLAAYAADWRAAL
ncbi:FGGY-family carbohydrate kinase [Oceanicola sp. S124]|uniref:FGGY-family carbohydrate kinase n=1 Tax=Oceanicola sp. S124 TaxID=1042378 RepID=UPI00025596DD|nr:FGGY-family carbohydrate kinase [Oceanicola sp. S124]